jgi:hypothetical protein
MSIDSYVIQSTYTFQSRFVFLFLFGYFSFSFSFWIFLCEHFVHMPPEPHWLNASARLALTKRRAGGICQFNTHTHTNLPIAI